MTIPAVNDKPCSEACERNREPIARVLESAFANCRRVLEIGSGTGQHAVHLARRLPHLTWQSADLPEWHAGILRWIADEGPPNLLAPIALDVRSYAWPAEAFDAVFSANTAHIMGWAEVERMFSGVGRVLATGGVFALYGPFRYGGRHTSDSNARFDAGLRARDPAMGVRDFEAVDALARDNGLALERDEAMPANNRTLVWRRQPRELGILDRQFPPTAG